MSDEAELRQSFDAHQFDVPLRLAATKIARVLDGLDAPERQRIVDWVGSWVAVRQETQ